MNGKKFRVIFESDENGKPVRRFVPYDECRTEPMYAVYGDYLKIKKERIHEAKKQLMENLFDALMALSQKDDFWIVNEVDADTITVGWKIHIPQMGKY